MAIDLSGLAATAKSAPPKAPVEPKGFSEAETVFQELRDFGESVVPNSPPETKAPETAAPVVAPASGGAVVTPPPPSAVAGVATGCRLTSGATLQGFLIDEYLGPVSLSCEVDSTQEEPLKPAFDKLAAKAQSLGANGVVDLKWVLSADSSRVVLSGVPVRCRKA